MFAIMDSVSLCPPVEVKERGDVLSLRGGDQRNHSDYAGFLLDGSILPRPKP